MIILPSPGRGHSERVGYGNGSLYYSSGLAEVDRGCLKEVNYKSAVVGMGKLGNSNVKSQRTVSGNKTTVPPHSKNMAFAYIQRRVVMSAV